MIIFPSTKKLIKCIEKAIKMYEVHREFRELVYQPPVQTTVLFVTDHCVKATCLQHIPREGETVRLDGKERKVKLVAHDLDSNEIRVYIWN